MELNIKRLSITYDLLTDYVPYEYISESSDDKTIVFSVTTELNKEVFPVCLLYYEISIFNSHIAELRYVRIDDAFAGHGLAMECFRKCNSLLRTYGAEKILVLLPLEDEPSYNRVLFGHGFVRCGNSIHHEYNLDSVVNTHLNHIPGIGSYLGHIKDFHDVPHSAIVSFTNYVNSKNRFLDFDDLNNTFSRFFYAEKRVLGYLLIEKLDNAAYIIKDCVIMHMPLATLTIPLGLISFYNYLKESGTFQENTVFIIQTGNNEIINASQKLLGSPILSYEYASYQLTL